MEYSEKKSALVFTVQEQNNEPVWRRFYPITGDLTPLQDLCEEKGLTKEDILLILKSVTPM